MGKKKIVSEAINEFHNAVDQFKNIAKKEITATVKGTDMFEFNGKWVNVAQLIKTSEELTIENTKLVKQIDLWKSYKDENVKLKNDLELETHFKICEREKVKDLTKDLNSALEVGSEYLIELQQIKSTRLYKFFKLLGVW